MATNGTSLPAATGSGSISEAPSLREGPSLDDLSPTQVQQLLEAVLQRFREEELCPSASGHPVMAASLLNSHLVPGTTVQGKRVRPLCA